MKTRVIKRIPTWIENYIKIYETPLPWAECIFFNVTQQVEVLLLTLLFPTWIENYIIIYALSVMSIHICFIHLQ